MNYDEVLNRVYDSFENAEIYVDREMDDLMEAKDYIVDSIQFIQLIVQLEKEFEIEMPDDLLLFENFETFEKICNLILGLL